MAEESTFVIKVNFRKSVSNCFRHQKCSSRFTVSVHSSETKFNGYFGQGCRREPRKIQRETKKRLLSVNLKMPHSGKRIEYLRFIIYCNTDTILGA